MIGWRMLPGCPARGVEKWLCHPLRQGVPLALPGAIA